MFKMISPTHPDDEGQGKDEYSKPGHDGRTEYWQTLKVYLMELGVAQTNMELEWWYRVLNGIYCMVLPYIKPEDADHIQQELNTVLKILDNLYATPRMFQGSIYDTREPNPTIQRLADRKLQELTQIIMKSTKHMLLPIREADSDEWDDKEFDEGDD